MTLPIRREELTRYMALGRAIAHSQARRFARSVDMGDLIAAANLGLADALARGDRTNARFESYVIIRMVGAIIDELRVWDHLSREDRLLMQKRYRAEVDLGHRLGREPNVDEVAEVLGVSVEKLREVEQASKAGHQPLPLEAPFGDGEERAELATGSETEELIDERRRSLLLLRSRATRLPPRTRVVLELYYEQDWTFKQIGDALGFTESRACQIRADAIRKLRAAPGIEECWP